MLSHAVRAFTPFLNSKSLRSPLRHLSDTELLTIGTLSIVAFANLASACSTLKPYSSEDDELLSPLSSTFSNTSFRNK